jgi:hypothetical protein
MYYYLAFTKQINASGLISGRAAWYVCRCVCAHMLYQEFPSWKGGLNDHLL